MPLAFPAVVDAGPQLGKAGLREASESAETPGRIVSSLVISVPRILIGTISSAKCPFLRAFLFNQWWNIIYEFQLNTLAARI